MAIETITTEQLEERVLRAPGPVALDFYQATCAPCRALEPRVEGVATSYAGRVAVYRIDIDRDFNLAAHFGINSLPTVVVLLGGKEISRLDGLILERDLEVAFDQALVLGPAC